MLLCYTSFSEIEPIHKEKEKDREGEFWFN
jgi:hypothetical protein